jgi:hypothetical protein
MPGWHLRRSVVLMIRGIRSAWTICSGKAGSQAIAMPEHAVCVLCSAANLASDSDTYMESYASLADVA